jgi:regulator of replication initiation timing
VSAPVPRKFEIPVWLQPDGAPLSCREKIKVLNENLEEIREMAQDALEDGILMGCDETQLREVLQALVESLENPYGKKGRSS